MPETLSARGTWARIQDAVVKYGFIAITAILFLDFSLTEPSFASSSSLFLLLKFASVTAILVLTAVTGFCPLYKLLKINTSRGAISHTG